MRNTGFSDAAKDLHPNYISNTKKSCILVFGTNTDAREVQSFGQNGPWLAGWLSKGKKFFVNLAQTLDEHLLKISAQ